MTLHGRWGAAGTNGLACCAMQRIRTILLSLAVALVGVGATAGSASARGNVLPDATYNVIVQVNAEFGDLDELTAAEITGKQYVAEAEKICRNYPTDSPLLKTARDRCSASVAEDRLMLQLAGDKRPACKTLRACRRVVQRIEQTQERWYRLAVQFNRIATETIPAGPCLAALTNTGNEMRHFRQRDRLTTADLQAWLKDDKRARKAIARRIKQLDKRIKQTVRPLKERNEQTAAHC